MNPGGRDERGTGGGFPLPRPGAAVGEAALERFCLRHLVRFKRPRTCRSIESLPKNNYGKVVKRILRERE